MSIWGLAAHQKLFLILIFHFLQKKSIESVPHYNLTQEHSTIIRSSIKLYWSNRIANIFSDLVAQMYLKCWYYQSMKMECDHLYGWIKKQKTKTHTHTHTQKNPVTYAKISAKMVSPRDIAGNAEEEEVDIFSVHTCPSGLGFSCWKSLVNSQAVPAGTHEAREWPAGQHDK